jgi:archaellum component FlaC
MIIEPIDLLKNELKRLQKAIDKCTVANYNAVSTNLNPWIEKYEKAIKRLQIKK